MFLHTPFFDMHSTTGLLVTVMVADKSPLTEHEKRWLSQVSHPALLTKEAKGAGLRKWFRAALQTALSPATNVEDLVKLYAKQLSPEYRSSVLDIVIEGGLIEENAPTSMPNPAKDRAIELLCRTWNIPEAEANKRVLAATERAFGFVQKDDITSPFPNDYFGKRSGGTFWLLLGAVVVAGAAWYFLRH